jgi:hypothetical protein
MWDGIVLLVSTLFDVSHIVFRHWPEKSLICDVTAPLSESISSHTLATVTLPYGQQQELKVYPSCYIVSS